MQNLNTPSVISKPFAENGLKNTIPENPTGTNKASLDEGFPLITATLPENGGIPPERADFNGVLNLSTQSGFFAQNGGTYTFSQEVSNAIGGYPLNARLWYTNENGESCVLRSTKGNNEDNFITNPSVIGNSWVYDIVTTAYITNEINKNRTNCITKIPKDIILELNNGVLTLKSGSKLYQPNGSGVFTEINISSDKTRTGGLANSKTMFFYDVSTQGIRSRNISSLMSGTTAPSDFSNGPTWWDISENKIKFYTSSGVLESSQGCLPLCICSSDSSGKIISIDQIFNGFGYLGKTAYSLPDVVGLIPYGRNNDGTLNNIEFSTSRVMTTTDTSNATGYYEYYLSGSGIFRANFGDFEYRQDENIIWNNNENRLNAVIQLSNYSYRTSGKIDLFNPRQAFQASDYYEVVKYSDKSEVVSWDMPDYNAAISTGSGSYTAPANGWYVTVVTHVTSGSTTNFFVNNINIGYISSDYNNNHRFITPLAKGQTITNDNSSRLANSYFYPCMGG